VWDACWATRDCARFSRRCRASHLRELDCADNGICDNAFAAGVLLPAVRANASLRALRLAAGAQAGAENPAREAEALVARRSARE
jgi:hypothetical protein